MKNRSPFAVFALPLITFGIYGIVWQVKTKNEMNARGAQIPTAWLMIVPFVNYYWIWKYSEGVEKTTNSEISGVMAFVLLFLLGTIGMAIIQNDFNKLGEQPAFAGAAPVGTSGDFAAPATPAQFSPAPIASPEPIQPTAAVQPTVNPEPTAIAVGPNTTSSPAVQPEAVTPPTTTQNPPLV